jgi:hypothetical protein
MPANINGRNPRNNPYLIEGWAVDFHRSKAGIAWRWRTELALTAALLNAYFRLAVVITTVWALINFAALITAALAIPAPRRYFKRRACCLISRHRLQRVCYEGRLHTRAGRLPLILWIRPTKVGERAHILCRAGICADDFDACKAEIGAGCYARGARVIRSKRYSHFVLIDIVRHDPLTADVIIPSKIIPPTRRAQRCRCHDRPP